ncbi:MAG: hypothetical protein WAW10_07405 [Gallionella sp.]
MQKFKVSAWPVDPAKLKYEPEWEEVISANLLGEALEQGEVLFLAHCKEHELARADFEVRSGTP